jgi:hypothetical protein
MLCVAVATSRHCSPKSGRAGQRRDGTWNAVNVNGVAGAGHEGADMLNASKLVLFIVGYVGIERWGVDSRRVVNV